METILIADDAADVLFRPATFSRAEGYTASPPRTARKRCGWPRPPGPIEGCLPTVVMPKVDRAEWTIGSRAPTRDQGGLHVRPTPTKRSAVRDMHAGAPFVGKPFTAALLARKLREALDYRSPFKRPAAPVRTASPVFA